MNTPLEDQVHDALARRVEPLRHSPLGLDGVRTRARRIQRRRRAVAGAAVAAVLAVAIPVGLSLDSPARRTEQPPVDRTPGIAQTVRIDPRSAAQGAGPAIPLTDYTAGTVTVGDEVVQLPKDYYQVTQYGDGWLATRLQDDGLRTIDVLTADLEVEDSVVGSSGFTASPDGTQVAWAERRDDRHWTVVAHDTARREGERTTTVPTGSADDSVVVTGFLSDGRVLVGRFDVATAPEMSNFVADDGQLSKVDGIRLAGSSLVTDLVTGGFDRPDDTTCWGTWDGDDLGAGPVRTDCAHVPLQLSPDGTRLAAYPAPTGPASENDITSVSLLDADTGRVLADFEVTPRRDRTVELFTQVAWEDDDHLLVTYSEGYGYRQWVVRLGVDGSVERVAGPVVSDMGAGALQVSPGLSPGRS